MKLTNQLTNDIAQWVSENGLIEAGGASITQLSKHFSISRYIFYKWMGENENFNRAITEAKARFKENLESDIVTSLARIARGYTYTETKTEKQGNKITKKTTRNVEVQPNVGAAIFLLTNIAPDRWKNKINNEVNADISGKVEESHKIQVTPEVAQRVADILQDEVAKHGKS